MSVEAKNRTFEESGLSIMSDVFGPILNRGVEISISSIEDASEETLNSLFPEPSILIEAPLEGIVSGNIYFVFSQKLSAGITDLMVMGDGTAPFNEQESLDGIAEAANQIVGAQATAWAEESANEVRSGGTQGKLASVADFGISLDQMVQVTFLIKIEDWGEETFVKLISKDMQDNLGNMIGGDVEAPAGAETDPFLTGANATDAPQQVSQAAPQSYKKADFGDFDSTEAMVPSAEMPKNLDLLMDINLPVTIELGRTSMLIRDVLEIGPGSVIELQKLSGEPVDLYINNKHFALGEVVVIDENFGIRITELLSVEDRIKALK
jgi:flagellar motor switch protein FliN/FliY